MQQQQMSPEEMLQGAQAKMTQLDVLLHEALQEKMELKQSYGQLQNNVNASMQSLAEAVQKTRVFLMENVKDNAAAEKICKLFDPIFGPFVPKGAPNVDQSTVA